MVIKQIHRGLFGESFTKVHTQVTDSTKDGYVEIVDNAIVIRVNGTRYTHQLETFLAMFMPTINVHYPS